MRPYRQQTVRTGYTKALPFEVWKLSVTSFLSTASRYQVLECDNIRLEPSAGPKTNSYTLKTGYRILREVKHIYNIATIARDGLLVARRSNPLQPPTELIIAVSLMAFSYKIKASECYRVPTEVTCKSQRQCIPEDEDLEDIPISLLDTSEKLLPSKPAGTIPQDKVSTYEPPPIPEVLCTPPHTTAKAQEEERGSGYRERGPRCLKSPSESKKPSVLLKGLCCIPNFSEFPAGQQCVNKAECECLCYKTAAYDYCDNNFKRERETLHSPICTGGPSIANAEPLRGIHRPHNVQRCFDTKCSDKISKRDCYNTAGCSWCSKSSELARLELEFCTEWDSCYFGIRGNSPTKYYRQDNGKSNGHHPESNFEISILLIIGPVVIFLSLISSASVLILWLKRRKIYLKSKRIPSTLPARADGVPPTENGYTHVVTRVFPDTPYVSRVQFGNVVYHHNFVFDHST
ncbi:uncharacterized protein LOC134238705 [Saccostrea cucullata]|uniref:uncharacterized protein LOC134238705 n=1 Tax=Saccostrea cuccullata TaxID=36930 RepID=UPI002ED0F621